MWELFEYEEGKFVFEHSEDTWLGCMKAVFSHLKFDEVCCLSWDAVSPSTSIVKFYTLITSLPITIKFLLTSDFWFVNILCITANKGCKSSGPGHQEISWWFGGYCNVFFFFLTCILLTDFEVYDASYGPCFFLLGFYGPLF